MKSRMVQVSDPTLNAFEYKGVKFEFYKRGWWSRIYEYQWLRDAAKEFLGNNIGDKSCLDIATGIQHPGMFLLKDIGFQQVVGIDLFPPEDFHFKDILGNGVSYVKGDVLDMRFHERFDCVSCISFLEHLPPAQQKQALLNIISVLKEKSCVIFTFDMPGYDYPTDLQMYKRVLLEHGFNLEEEPCSGEILTTINSLIAAKELKKMNLSCYRMFAWR